MRFRVTYLDGRVDTVVSTASARQLWEEEFDGSVYDAAVNGMSACANWVVWKTLVRTRVIDENAELMEFLDTIESVEVERPADAITYFAKLLGWVPADEDSSVPPGSTGKAPSRNGSRKPRSKAATTSSDS